MMSLFAPQAVTVSLRSHSNVQQLAIFINSLAPYIELFSFIVDLNRLLIHAQDKLNSLEAHIENSKSRSWFISKPLKDRLQEAISENTPENSINRALYKYGGSLQSVVVFHIMYADAFAQRTAAENTIRQWPVVGQQLLSALLNKLVLHEDISYVLRKNYRQHMKAPEYTQPPSPKRVRIDLDTFLGHSLEFQAQAETGQEMVVARVQESKEHILHTLLSGVEQSQHNGEGDQQSSHTQTPFGVGGPGGQDGVSMSGREGQVSNSGTAMTTAPSVLATSQPPSQHQPQLPQGQSLAQLRVPTPNSTPENGKDLRRINLPVDSASFWDSLQRIVSGNLSESLQSRLKNEQKASYQRLKLEKLNIILPPHEPEPGQGVASKDLPVIMCIRSELEFHFTKETTRHIMRSEFGPDAKYHQLHSLTGQDLLGYLERSLNQTKTLRATGMLNEGTVWIFIQNVKGSPFEVTMHFNRKLFMAIVLNLEDTPEKKMGMLRGMVQN